MPQQFSRGQILAILCSEIADCLAKEVEEVQPEAAFFSDLGGESIDLLDITFRMQKQCGVRAPFQEFVQGLEFDSNGRLSSKTVEKLNQEFPAVEWENRAERLLGNDPRDLLTVDLIAELLFNSQTANEGAISESVSS